MTHQVTLWAVFSVLIVACLGIDLFAGRHRHGRMPVRVAAIWSLIWIGLAFVFAGAIWVYPPEGGDGQRLSILFLTGYLVEKALSVDNMFVFIMIFAYFAVAEEDQPRVLKWGIIGAVVFRALLISASALLLQFKVVLYVFALLLVWAGWKLLTSGDEEIHPEQNAVLRAARRFFPIVNRYEGHHFVTKEGGKWHGTALLVVLIVVESTDIVFAIDSIPAIFAITRPEVLAGRLTPAHEFFIVFTSNVFAILGLRALFFVLAGIMDMFRYLKVGVAVILFFVAGKMLAHDLFHVPPHISLAVIGTILATSILVSVFVKPRHEPTVGPESGSGERPGAAPAEPGAVEASHARKGREPEAR